MYLAELQASFLLFLLALDTDKFSQFPHDWLSSRSLKLHDFFDRSCPERHLCFQCYKCNTVRTVKTRKQV